MVIVGFGHKARQGKDYVAKYIAKYYGDAFNRISILSFAEALYGECRNKNRYQPLIKILGDNVRLLFPEGERVYGKEQVPEVFRFMEQRGINEYWGMDEKDALLLQLWGTDIRRKLFSENFWVDIVREKIHAIKSSEGKSLILIPDTRFKNEYQMIKDEGGYYVEVVRINENGQIFSAPDRDTRHKSETDLDDVKYDYLIIAKSGDLKRLERQADYVIRSLILKRV